MLTGTLLFAVILAQDWNFNSEAIAGIPKGWESRGDSKQQVYEIKEEPNGNRYLTAESHGSDVQLGVVVNVRPRDFSTLSWNWRVSALPRDADERDPKRLDSAASVYAVFGSRLFPRILKYVWSTSVPAGSSFKHPNSGRMAIIVVKSGGGSLGIWQTVKRDLDADYRAAFGAPPPDLIAIGVKTDSDSTGTFAQADYDDIRISRR